MAPNTQTGTSEEHVLSAKELGSLDHAVTQMLTESELLSADTVRSVAERSGGTEAAFERLLLQEGHLTEEQLAWVKEQAHGEKFVNLRQVPLTGDVLSLLPRPFVLAQQVVPFQGGEEVHVAVPERCPPVVHHLLRKKFGPRLRARTAMESALAEALSHYDSSFGERSQRILARYAAAQQAQVVTDDSVLELVDSLLLHSVREHASDVHLEPRAHDCVVRVRIDGVLRQLLRYPREVHPLIVLRIKVLSRLATDEHSVPQDGKFSFEGPGGKQVDVRVSIVATTQGEKIALRLLIAQNWALSLEQLGLSQEAQQILQQEIQESWGMILATGPTGCGKTTTLYALLRCLNSEDEHIATIEDPVEYDLPGTNQIQVNEKVGLTFATGLRSIVRQDPDVMLVGEVRDAETANIAVNSAMTGHLVLSTLHTNDAATAILRLRNMGIEPFLISSTVNVIVAQRLVRRICMRCRSSRELVVDELARSLPQSSLEKIARKQKVLRVYRGVGCELCSRTGYKGRTGIFEVLRVQDAIRSLIMQQADADVIEHAAASAGMTTMLENGLEKALQGVTTVEEVLRVIRSS